MSLVTHKITTYTQSIKDLPDRVTGNAAQLKAMFDSRTDNEVKDKHNALIDALDTTFYDKTAVDTAINERVALIGAGDMTQAVYDPNGKAADIFDYTEKRAGGEFTGTSLAITAHNGIQNVILYGATGQSGTGTPAPTNIRAITSASNAFMVNSSSYTLPSAALLTGSTRHSKGTETHVRKLLSLTGSENFVVDSVDKNLFNLTVTGLVAVANCSHFNAVPGAADLAAWANSAGVLSIRYGVYNSNAAGFKAWLSAQNSASTPVQVEYTITEETSTKTAVAVVETGAVTITSATTMKVIVNSIFLETSLYDSTGSVLAGGGLVPMLNLKMDKSVYDSTGAIATAGGLKAWQNAVPVTLTFESGVAPTANLFLCYRKDRTLYILGELTITATKTNGAKLFSIPAASSPIGLFTTIGLRNEVPAKLTMSWDTIFCLLYSSATNIVSGDKLHVNIVCPLAN